MNPIPSALAGTISEFDFTSGVGLIDADNGDIVFFNVANLYSDPAPLLDIGFRVDFVSHEETFGLHADCVWLKA